MRKQTGELLVIKHSRADRGYVISREDGGRVGSIICNQTTCGMDIFITNAHHDVWMVLDVSQDAGGSVAFLVPVGTITGKIGNFRLFGRLARSTSKLGNKFVFQFTGEQDVLVAIGSALSRSFVIRRGGRDIAEITKGTKSLEIRFIDTMASLDKAIVIGIAIASSFQVELKSNLKEDMKPPKVLVM